MINLILIALFLHTSSTVRAASCDIQSQLKKLFVPGKDAPVEMEVITADVFDMDARLIEEVQKNGKKHAYFVDSQNRIQFANIEKLPQDKNNFIVLKDRHTSNGFVIKETGEFYYDKEKKDFIFKQKNAIDLQPGEIDAAIQENTKLKFTREVNPEFEKARVMKCTENMGAQLRGDSFVKDGVISSAVVTTAGFVTINPGIFNPHSENWDYQMRLLTSDLTANIASSYVSGKMIKPFLGKENDLLKDFVRRTATDLATNTIIKRPIYDFMNPENEEDKNKTSLGTKLVPYDTGFSVVRFFPKRGVQRWTVNTLPKIMLASCLKNPNINFVVGPRMVRILDQYSWGLIYQGGRKLYLNQTTEESAK